MCTTKRVAKVLDRMGYRANYDSIRDYISLIWDNNEIVIQCLYGWYAIRYIDGGLVSFCPNSILPRYYREHVDKIIRVMMTTIRLTLKGNKNA